MKGTTYARIPRWVRLGYWLAWLYCPEFRSPVRFRAFTLRAALLRARTIDGIELSERGTI